jgi:uncharacterized protein (TIGR03437 family)
MLVDTLVSIQGTPLPLNYVSAQQVNAVVPHSRTSTSPNAPLQILIQRGTILSQPVYVTVATSQPTISGSPGAVTDSPSNYPASPSYTVSTTAPALAEDMIVIYCLGWAQ